MGISSYAVNTRSLWTAQQEAVYQEKRRELRKRYNPDRSYSCEARFRLGFFPQDGKFSCTETRRAWDTYMKDQQAEHRGRYEEKVTFGEELKAAVQAVKNAQGSNVETQAKVKLYQLLCNGKRQLRSWFLGTPTVGSQVCDALAKALAKDEAVAGHLAADRAKDTNNFVSKRRNGR